MSAQIIAFPRAANNQLISQALARLNAAQARMDDPIATPMQRAVAEAMMTAWEEELVHLGGVPRRMCLRDGLDAVGPDGQRWERM